VATDRGGTTDDLAEPAEVLPAPGAGLADAGRELMTVINDNKVASLLLYAGFVFVKVLAVSRWTVATALGVLNVSSLPAVVAGATLSALPMIALVLLASIVFLWSSGYWSQRWAVPGEAQPAPGRRVGWRMWLGRMPARARRSKQMLWCLAIVATLSLLIPPWALTLVAVASGLALGFGVRMVRHVRAKSAPEGSPSQLPFADRQVLAGFLVLTVVLSILGYSRVASAMWIPHETLVAPDGHVVVIGYVISDNGSVITVLQSHKRSISFYRSDQVGSRFICEDRYSYPFPGAVTYSAASLLQVLTGQGQPPACGAAPH
jgi:hypothetical protein